MNDMQRVHCRSRPKNPILPSFHHARYGQDDDDDASLNKVCTIVGYVLSMCKQL